MPIRETDRHPLETWGALNDAMYKDSLSEKECWDLLAEEKKGQARATFMLRLYGRANTLRTARERLELTHGAKA